MRIECFNGQKIQNQIYVVITGSQHKNKKKIQFTFLPSSMKANINKASMPSLLKKKNSSENKIAFVYKKKLNFR